jgi:hypothetical protein
LLVTHESGAFVDGVYQVTTSYTHQIMGVVPQAATPNEIATIPLEAGERHEEVLVSWTAGNVVFLGDLVAYNGWSYKVVKEQYRAEANFQRFVMSRLLS